jgi:endonuclease YncB( thermonuclease family)
MRPRLLVLALLGSLGLWAALPSRPPAAAAVPGGAFAGLLSVEDADTVVIGGLRVRLAGIDAPEAGQDCRDRDGRPWDCGAWATEAARALLEGVEADCRGVGTDGYGRLLARCEAAGRDLGRLLVEQGIALAYLDQSSAYAEAERAAAAAGRGLWRGEFERPADWRRARRAAAAEAPPAGCLIKGNLSAAGRVYHLPGSPSYEDTRIDTARGERWFCSAAEAEAAGWRAARN